MSALMNYTFQSFNLRAIPRAQSGPDFDRAYLKQSGVDGHEKLNATMDKVQSKAADATLNPITATALPLIKAHMQVSQDGLKGLG
jgi:putative membrane protein